MREQDRLDRVFGERLRDLGAKLVITGTGVAAEELRASITTDRVEMLGLVSDERLKEELRTADLLIMMPMARVEEHLAGCPACREEHESLKALLTVDNPR